MGWVGYIMWLSITEVRHDIYEAQQVGVRGVPFFVINRKYAVSGAQESDVFLEVLNKSWSVFEREVVWA